MANDLTAFALSICSLFNAMGLYYIRYEAIYLYDFDEYCENISKEETISNNQELKLSYQTLSSKLIL